MTKKFAISKIHNLKFIDNTTDETILNIDNPIEHKPIENVMYIHRPESKNIGVFGTREQFKLQMIKIIQSLPPESINIAMINKNSQYCYIDLNNGERYIGLLLKESARGYRWKQVYVPKDCDMEMFYNVVYCKLISNLPESEQVVWYECES